MRVRALALVVSALIALGMVSAPAAQASTNGTPDTANKYSNVGLIAFYDADGRFRCSATLVSSTVLLTAAHCTDGTLGRTAVTFEPFLAEAPPAPLPTAADPSKGYTDADLAGTGYYAGTAYTHPKYSGFTDLDNWNDVGVIVLDKPVAGITPAPIASLGTLDRIKKSDLSKTTFTAVGYGTEVRKSDSGPQKPTPQSYPLLRRYVTMPGQKLTPQVLQTNGSATSNKSTGLTCFGDSGGPVFLNGEIVAVTSYGLNDVCRGISGYQRVDIKVVQDWLGAFGVTAG
jgi:secreted trypsin-like serine protease